MSLRVLGDKRLRGKNPGAPQEPRIENEIGAAGGMGLEITNM
jgi:hypothetical protein